MGGAAIDRTPAPVKDWAIRNFGEDDKLILQLGILATLAVLAVLIGVVALRFRRAGAAGVLAFGVVGAAAAVSRPDSTGIFDALPSVVGAIVAAVLLYLLIGRLTTPQRAGAGTPDEETGYKGWDRRGFLVAAPAAAVASVGAGALGRYLNRAKAQDAVASRSQVTLPAPDSPAAPIPAGAQVEVPGVSPSPRRTSRSTV